MNCKTNKLAVAVFVACNTGFFVSAAELSANMDDGIEVTAVEKALSHLTSKRLGGPTDLSSGLFLSKDDSFVARDVMIDMDGAQHVRFDRKLRGLRVIGGDVVVHSSANGQLLDVSHGADSAKSAASAAKRSAIDITARDGAEATALVQANAMFQGISGSVPVAEKVFYARDVEPTLAFDVLIKGMSTDGTPSEMHYIIDAQKNILLDSFDDVRTLLSRDSSANIKMLDAAIIDGAAPSFGEKSVSSLAKAAAAGTGQSLLSGTVSLTTNSVTSGYELRDPSRGSHYATNLSGATSGNGTIFTDADNLWGNFATTSSRTAAVDAVYGQNLTWDFYKNVLGRNGIANNGSGAFSRIHYGSNYVNAFWSDGCFCMTYGDGNGTTYLPLVAIDVAGHEMTHGVTARTANLTYSGESGGLNEAISDMFGTSVEFYANNASSRPDYLIGERIFASNKGVATPTKALRYMFKPSLDGSSPDCYTSSIGSLDVHYSSGVANHFFYLVSQGAVSPPGFTLSASQLVCNGNTALAGIGRTAAIKIVYRALTTYMISSTNYKGARTAMLRAATDLYGSTSTQYNGVAAAWSAVNVN